MLNAHKINNWFKRLTWKKVKELVFGKTIYRKIFLIYLLAIILGTAFLYAPFSLNPGWQYVNNHYVWYDKNGQIFQEYSYFDAIFFASSAFSDTGLVTKTTAYVFNMVGQGFLLVLIQLGGMGIIAIFIILWQLFIKRNHLTFQQHQLLHSERGNNQIGKSYKMVFFAFLVVLIVQLIGWLILSLFFYYVPPVKAVNGPHVIKPAFAHYDYDSYYHNWHLAIWAGFFHIISATNNAGFDILGTNSIQPFRNGVGNILSVVIVLGLFIGGIGYPVFYDCYSWIKKKIKHQHYQITLFTKISLITYFIVLVVGIVLILAFELPQREHLTQIYWTTNEQITKNAQNSTVAVFGWDNQADKVWNFIFNSISSRSAGFASIDMNDLSHESKWLINALMFIGASPASTGGGIRTVTLAIICLYLYNHSLGRKYVGVFKKTIHRNLVLQSFLTFVLAIALVFSAAVIISASSRADLPFINILFEAASAFGTSGLSTGITQSASTVGLVAIIFLMFIGQLGVSNTLLIATKKLHQPSEVRYPYEDLKVS